jgi:hypothetical protein
MSSQRLTINLPVAKLAALTEAAKSFLIEFMEKQETEISVREINKLVEEAKSSVRRKPTKK